MRKVIIDLSVHLIDIYLTKDVIIIISIDPNAKMVNFDVKDHKQICGHFEYHYYTLLTSIHEDRMNELMNLLLFYRNYIMKLLEVVNHMYLLHEDRPQHLHLLFNHWVDFLENTSKQWINAEIKDKP